MELTESTAELEVGISPYDDIHCSKNSIINQCPLQVRIYRFVMFLNSLDNLYCLYLLECFHYSIYFFHWSVKQE